MAIEWTTPQHHHSQHRTAHADYSAMSTPVSRSTGPWHDPQGAECSWLRIGIGWLWC